MKNSHHNAIKTHLVYGCHIACAIMLSITAAQANDSSGYIGIGGVAYIKNRNITMHSEDLYISKNRVRVNYEFKNLSNKNVTETVLFPMPAVPSSMEVNFADTNATYDTFKIWVDGKVIIPDMHVRTFMNPFVVKDGERFLTETPIDTTAIFKACGISDAEMTLPWISREDAEQVTQRLATCKNKALDKFIYDRTDPYIFWDSQVIYSWQQTFKAKATTKIKHTYTPLVGGSVHMDSSQYGEFCVDKSTQRSLVKNNIHPYSALSYILTTGANWAKPIANFKLTVQRDPNELVSFCWKGKGKVNKVGATTFEIKETNFVPTHDFNVAFINAAGYPIE